MSISDALRVVRAEWDDFQSFYEQQLHSSVEEMDLMTRYMYEQRGKQLRPLLVFLCAKLNGNVGRRTQVGATMVELLHTGTLLHDDVIDEASERRGALSVNALWQSKAAVLSGDFLFARGLMVAVENDAPDLLRILAFAVQEVGEGEILQMRKAQLLDTDEPLYFEIIRKKTASLVQACTHIGAVSVSVAKPQEEAMKDFGNLLGIAFQLRDDVLDYNSAEVTGKAAGNDIREKKLTLPLIHSLRQVDQQQQQKMLGLLEEAKTKPENVAQIMDFVRQNNGLKYADEMTLRYAARAKDILANYPASEVREALMGLVDYVALREK